MEWPFLGNVYYKFIDQLAIKLYIQLNLSFTEVNRRFLNEPMQQGLLQPAVENKM